jgi:hypothetical protein
MREGESVFRSTRTPLESHGIELAKINVLLDAGAISQDTYSRAVNALTEDFKSSTGVTAENEAALKSIEDQQQKTFDAWSDNISGVLSQTLDLDDVLKNLANTLLRDAFVNPLLISVGLGGAGNSAGGSAGGGSNDIFGAISSGYNAFDGATSGAFNSFATSGVGKSLGLSSTSSAFTGAKSGIGTTTSLTGAGDFLGGGFSGASSLGGLAAGLLGLGSGDTLVDTTTSVLGGAIGNFLLPGIGGAIGSFLGTSLGGMFGGSGKPTSFSFSSQDEQERFEGQNAFTMDSAFGETLFKVFNGRDEDTNIVAAMTPIINTIAALESSIASTFIAAQYGRVTAGVASADFRSEDADAAVNNFVESRLGAILTELGPQFTELSNASELVGVASLQYTAMLVAVNEQLEQGGPLIGLFNDDLNSTVAFLNQIKNDDQTLAQAFEGLAQVQAVYYENFFTEQERFDKVLDSATASLDEFNSSIGLAGDAAIDTRAEFRDYVEALDLTSEAGRQALESALGLQGALLFVANAADAAAGATVKQVESLVDQDLAAANLAAAQLQINTRNSVSKVLSDTAKKDKDLATAADLDARNANTQALDSLNIVRSSFGVVKDAVALQKDVINEKISDLSGIVDSAFSARNSLRSSNLIASSIDRESAQDIIKRAAGGEQISAREITSSLDIISEPAENLFKTFVDYQRDFSKTSISISDLENNTKDALTSEERSLQALTDIENNAQSQLNALLGIDSRVLSLSESLNTFSSSLASSKASAVAATTAASTAKVANDTADASAALLSSDTQTNDRTDFRSFVDSITSDYKTGAGAGTGRLTTDEGFQIYNYAAANNISLNQVDEFLGFTGDQALRFVQDNNLPAFANGGNHSGGLRMVGEVGPELELTGPSRIISNSDLMSGLSKNDENSGGDDQMNRLLSKIQLFLDRIYRQQQQWTADALNVRVVT